MIDDTHHRWVWLGKVCWLVGGNYMGGEAESGCKRAGDSMYWWNNQFSVLRHECLTARQRFNCSKGDPLLREAWKIAESTLRQGIKKIRLQCCKYLIGEVENDPWRDALKIVTKRLVSRRKNPGLDNPDRVKCIVRNLFPHVELFQKQGWSSCLVRCEELFTLEELKRTCGRLKANTAPRSTGCQTRSSKTWSRHTRRSSWKPSTTIFGRGGSS